jgi:hypothetical protein
MKRRRPRHCYTPGYPRTACAATILRWLWAVVTTGRAWDARIAAGQIPARPAALAVAAAA